MTSRNNSNNNNNNDNNNDNNDNNVQLQPEDESDSDWMPSACFPPCQATSHNALDFILVQRGDTVVAGPIVVQSPTNHMILEIVVNSTQHQWPVIHQTIQKNTTSNYNHKNHRLYTAHDPQALQEIAQLLKPGPNKACYKLNHAIAHCTIFLWSHAAKILVVDIDGTITKSNIRGVMDTVITEQYQYCHDGVCEFLQSIKTNIVYLTSRPLTIAGTTRRFLTELRQDQTKLPPGPLLGFPGTMAQVLVMELVRKNVATFKSRSLHTIVQLFQQLQVPNPLVGAFGNSSMDMQAYHQAGIPLKHIYWVDKQSQIYCLNVQSDKIPRRKREYLRARGTLFRGYRDGQLARELGKCLTQPSSDALTVPVI